MMAMTGSFDAKEIANSALMTSLMGAVSQVLSGKWEAALGYAAVAGLALGAKKFVEWIQKGNEKLRLQNDQVYNVQGNPYSISTNPNPGTITFNWNPGSTPEEQEAFPGRQGAC